jgi:hypothetical protein
MADKPLKISGGISLMPAKSDPQNPKEGDIFRAGSAHPSKKAGTYEYKDGEWTLVNASSRITKETSNNKLVKLYSQKIKNHNHGIIKAKIGAMNTSTKTSNIYDISITFKRVDKANGLEYMADVKILFEDDTDIAIKVDSTKSSISIKVKGHSTDTVEWVGNVEYHEL